MMALLWLLACVGDGIDTATEASISFTAPEMSPVSFNSLGSTVWLDIMHDGAPLGGVLMLSESDFSCERVKQLITIGYLDEDIDPAALVAIVAWDGAPVYGELAVDGTTLTPEGQAELQLLAYDRGTFWSFDWAGGGVLSLTEADSYIVGTLETPYVTSNFAARRCESPATFGGVR